MVILLKNKKYILNWIKYNKKILPIREKRYILNWLLKKDKLPEEYQQLNYIESTGPQWIDTEISGDCDIDITCQGTLDNNKSQIVVGRYTLAGRYFGQVTTNHKWGMGVESTGGLTDILYLDKERFLLSFRQNESIINAKGKTYRVAIDDFYNYTYALCRAKEKSGNAYYAASVRIFNCRIRQDGELVRDYVPAKRIIDGEIGLYDRITKSFFVNLGTDSFIEG